MVSPPEVLNSMPLGPEFAKAGKNFLLETFSVLDDPAESRIDKWDGGGEGAEKKKKYHFSEKLFISRHYWGSAQYFNICKYLFGPENSLPWKQLIN